ncbi:hypothetical protein NMD99_06590 [Wolbachia endosymbiont of Listronotus oregonensis]|uniref:hypothetical protein n=1 Tax=Wolbachia endosymbiont of Listronotus oregonensis TaxID=2969106 RepID=UPI00281514E3|nr:hypothetical protein [Wolbachia endosymbiont of Listronotus oregonensis]WMT84274.1 hypothetical protein NMD99_06590 [Wolbachia endosymbiont of Listronotus oregonensis]
MEKFKFNSKPTYITDRGAAYCGDSLNLLPQLPDNSLDLVITSPPFALQRKKNTEMNPKPNMLPGLVDLQN